MGRLRDRSRRAIRRFRAAGRDAGGQGLVEYAFMTGFFAAAAGAVLLNVARGISMVFFKVDSVMASALGY